MNCSTPGLPVHYQLPEFTQTPGPITSWEIYEDTMERVRKFVFLGSKITADGDCRHEIKRCLLFGKKAMTNVNSTLKQKYHFVNKGPSSQSYDFSSSHVRI